MCVGGRGDVCVKTKRFEVQLVTGLFPLCLSVLLGVYLPRWYHSSCLDSSPLGSSSLPLKCNTFGFQGLRKSVKVVR